MPRRKSGIVTARADKRKRVHNTKVRTELKKAVKKFQALVAAKNTKEASGLLTKLYSLFDKAAKKGVVHPNTANRKKSRFKKSFSKISQAA
ncbi:MAG: 30S ribosomal protein S20 [Candidatus Omnitrophota bacterium]